jgi:MFS family permease
MKLNYRKTFYIGIAFFIISLFWQSYDTIVQKILVDKFGMSQGLSGFIMALDNILGLFLLPLFGYLSDKTKCKMGKRTPYIIIGTVLTAIFFVGTTFADNLQLAKLQGITDNQYLYDSGILDEPSLKVDGIQIKQAMADEGIDRETFIGLTSENNPEAFNKFVKAAQDEFAWQKTKESPKALIIFMVLLFLVLLSMSIFRTPAVALMPDVTPKPLRSKANAVINLMGALAGILVVGLGIFFKTDTPSAYMSYTPYFSAVSTIMILFLILFLFKVKEPKLNKEYQEELIKYNLTEEKENIELQNAKLSKNKLRSLFFLLTSVFLWFMSYNAVTSKFALYSNRVLNFGFNLPLIIAQGVAVLSFIPIGIISSRIGRKKSILIGICMMCLSFFAAYFLTPSTADFMYPIFIIAGLGWAGINVNSYPMVVEMAKGANIGRYTGFYYTASMSAQILTPILSGILMDLKNMTLLFPYSALFSVLALITMLFVQHGDSRPEAKKGIEAFDVDLN